MAANIAIGSLVLASDGVTLTGTLSGGSGAGYAISSAAGLQPHNTVNGGTWSIPSATPVISGGTTITIILPTPMLSAQSVTLGVAATNTITDGGGNTGATNAGYAVTNNSTQTGATTTITSSLSSFNFLGALVLAGGGVTENGALAPQCSTTENTGYSIEYIVNVTSGTVHLDVDAYIASSDRLRWSIDAAAGQTYQGWGLSFEYVRIATSLGVGKHLIRHNAPSANYTRSVRIVTTSGAATITTVAAPVAIFKDSVANLTVTNGVSPVKRFGTIKYTSNFINNNHAGFQFRAAGNYQGVNLVAYTGGGAGTQICVANDQAAGAPLDSFTLAGYTDPGATLRNLYYLMPVTSGLTPAAHTTEVLDVAQNGFKALMTFNGSVLSSSASIGDGTISVANITNIADGDWLCVDYLHDEEWVQVASHSGSGPYTLTLAANLTKAHANATAVRNLTPANAPTLTVSAAPAFVGRLMFMGDSITAAEAIQTNATFPAAGYSGYDPRASYAAMASRAAGYDFIDAATQGWTAAQVASDNAPNTYNVGIAMTSYVVLIGTNDYGSGNTPLATFQTNISSIITNIKTASPSGAQILFVNIFSTVPGTTPNSQGATMANYNTRIQTAITAAAQSGFVFQFVALATLAGLNLSAANVDIPDGTHPSITSGLTAGTGGQNKLAAALLPFLGVPANVTPPVVSGTATVGQTLSTTNGTWNDNGSPTFSYQWFRGTSATPIAAATSSNYTLVAGDLTKLVGCTVTDTDLGGAASTDSNTVGPVAAAATSTFSFGGAAVALRFISRKGRL